MDVDRLVSRLNPAVVWLLRSRLHPLLSWGLLVLTVTGRRTGRRYAIPVGYQGQGDVLTVLVSRASRKQWWRNYRAPAPVEVHVCGRTVPGRACVLAPDSFEFRDAVDATLRRLPGIAGQFGIRFDGSRGLTAEQWRTVAANGAVVRIELDGRDGRTGARNGP